jgi:hypothetical protein
VIKHVEAIKLRIAVAAVLTAVAVPVARHFPKLSAHLATALAFLNAHNPGRRSILRAGSTWEKRVGGERRNAINSV